MIRKKRRAVEAAIQTAVMLHVETRGRPDVFVFHVPNGGSRHKIEAANLKKQGVIAGVPDLCVVIRGFAHFLEIKAPGGVVSINQRATVKRLRDAGAVTAVAHGLDEALAILREWGAFRDDRMWSAGELGRVALADMRVKMEMRK